MNLFCLFFQLNCLICLRRLYTLQELKQHVTLDHFRLHTTPPTTPTATTTNTTNFSSPIVTQSIPLANNSSIILTSNLNLNTSCGGVTLTPTHASVSEHNNTTDTSHHNHHLNHHHNNQHHHQLLHQHSSVTLTPTISPNITVIPTTSNTTAPAASNTTTTTAAAVVSLLSPQQHHTTPHTTTITLTPIIQVSSPNEDQQNHLTAVNSLVHKQTDRVTV